MQKWLVLVIAYDASSVSRGRTAKKKKKLKKQEQGYLLHDKKNCIFLPFLSSLDRKNLKSWWTLLQFFYLSSKT
jgi:hypothetical protein